MVKTLTRIVLQNRTFRVLVLLWGLLMGGTSSGAAPDTLRHYFTKSELRPSSQEGTELLLEMGPGERGKAYIVHDTLPFTRQSGVLRLLNTPVGSVTLLDGISPAGMPETYVTWQFTYTDQAVMQWSIQNAPTGVYQVRGALLNSEGVLLDEDRTCLSVKAIECPWNLYEWVVRAPKGLSQYRWFNNGVLIEGATADTLACERPGRYYMESPDGCGLKMCCPFIIEEDTMPNFTFKTFPATCGGTSDLGDGSLDVSIGEMAELSLVTVLVYTLQNELILETQMGSLQNARLTNTLSAGTYRLRVRSESGCEADQFFSIDRGECCIKACPPFYITKRTTKRP